MASSATRARSVGIVRRLRVLWRWSTPGRGYSVRCGEHAGALGSGFERGTLGPSCEAR
jgi:hypothetical protein